MVDALPIVTLYAFGADYTMKPRHPVRLCEEPALCADISHYEPENYYVNKT